MRACVSVCVISSVIPVFMLSSVHMYETMEIRILMYKLDKMRIVPICLDKRIVLIK